jgi:hypothetical protein
MDVEKFVRDYFPVARTLTIPTVITMVEKAIAQDRKEREVEYHQTECPGCKMPLVATVDRTQDPLAAKLETILRKLRKAQGGSLYLQGWNDALIAVDAALEMKNGRRKD